MCVWPADSVVLTLPQSFGRHVCCAGVAPRTGQRCGSKVLAGRAATCAVSSQGEGGEGGCFGGLIIERFLRHFEAAVVPEIGLLCLLAGIIRELPCVLFTNRSLLNDCQAALTLRRSTAIPSSAARASLRVATASLSTAISRCVAQARLTPAANRSVCSGTSACARMFTCEQSMAENFVIARFMHAEWHDVERCMRDVVPGLPLPLRP
jgi:hypothetical protein